MKTSTILLLLLLFFSSASAQNYRLFQPSKLHYFSSTDNYTIRVDSFGYNGADSVFYLNKRAEPKVPNCTTTIDYGFNLGLEGFFGDHFIEQPNGRIVVVSKTGDSLFFETNFPTNTNWNFNALGTMTAKIVNKTSANTFGVPDSLLEIEVTNGSQNHIIELSKEFGFYSGKNLGIYFGLPDLGNATLAFPAKAFKVNEYVQWQAGESFTYVYHSLAAVDYYDNYRVMNRYESPNGDTVILYTELRQSYFDLASSGNFGFFPLELDTLVYAWEDLGMISLATHEINSIFPELYYAKSWLFDGQRIKRNYGRYGGTISDLDQNGSYIGGIYSPDGCIAAPYQFTEGLGVVHWEHIATSTITTSIYATHELICYSQNGDSVPCPPNALLTGTKDLQTMESKLWLSSNDEIGKLNWESMQAGEYEMKIYDLSGKVLFQNSLLFQSNGEFSFTLPKSNGIYLLALENTKTGQFRHLKFSVMNR